LTTLLVTHEACLMHDTGRHHPESPSRLRAVLEALSGPAFPALKRQQAPVASREQLARAHDRGFVDRVLAAIPAAGHAALDADTILSPGSGEAAQRAAGAVIAAVDAVMTGDATNAFCAVRPPGHHAEHAQAMGFCVFNNIAVGAYHARAAHGIRRVAVIDFDVHHGNGTQDIFWSDPDLLYASTHQSPLYPGTGARGERGVGNIFNVPLRPGSGSTEFRAAIDAVVLPALESFAPELVLISAGFDAHSDDPLAGLEFVEADYAWVTRRLVDVARRHCNGRVVSSLEGGYDIKALGASAVAHVGALMDA
jgi:acetoin utilization deacetylase AcuC-like enzyme